MLETIYTNSLSRSHTEIIAYYTIINMKIKNTSIQLIFVKSKNNISIVITNLKIIKYSDIKNKII